MLQGGFLTVTATLRGRSFAELQAPAPPEPSLPAEVSAALPAAGAAPPDGAEVAFRSADGERIWAHSFILATCSPTLRAALWGPLSKQGAARCGELDMPGGVDVSTFRRVLKFMYTDMLPSSEPGNVAAERR